MLTYLDCAPSQRLGKCAQGFAAVADMARRTLAVIGTPRFPPCEVVHDGELLSPEYGGAVGHGQDARVDEAFERAGPCVAGSKSRLRPASVS